MKIAWCLSCCALGLLLSAFPLPSLRAADEGDDLVPLVVNLLTEKDKDLRALGFEQVRTQAKGKKATEQFAALLPKLGPDAQVGLLSALADRADPAARSGVVELLAAVDCGSVPFSGGKSVGEFDDIAGNFGVFHVELRIS